MKRRALWPLVIVPAAGLLGCGGGSESAAPVRELSVAGTLPLSGVQTVRDVAASGRIVYLAGRLGLHAIDARNLSAPTLSTLPAVPSGFPDPYDDVARLAASGERLAVTARRACHCFGDSAGTVVDLYESSHTLQPRRFVSGFGFGVGAAHMQGDMIYVARYKPLAVPPFSDAWELTAEKVTSSGAVSGVGAALQLSVSGPLVRVGSRLLVPFSIFGTGALGYHDIAIGIDGSMSLVGQSPASPTQSQPLMAVAAGSRLFWSTGSPALSSVSLDALGAAVLKVELPQPIKSIAWQAGPAPILWLALGTAGAVGYDVSDPAHPRVVARLATQEPAFHISVHDGYGVVITSAEIVPDPYLPGLTSNAAKSLHLFALP